MGLLSGGLKPVRTAGMVSRNRTLCRRLPDMASSVYPPNPATPVGFFRSELPDLTTTLIDTSTNPDTAEYEFFTDAQIEAYLDNYDDVPSAMSAALSTIGRRLLILAQDIQVDDIRIKTVERARWFMEHADKVAAGALAGSLSEAFQIVSTNVVQPQREYEPQGTPHYFGSL